MVKIIPKIPEYDLELGNARLIEETQEILKRQGIVTVAVGGGYASGKTSAVAKALHRAFEKISLLYSIDDYYRGVAYMKEQAAKGNILNWDQPEALNMELFLRQFSELKSGKPIKKPVYDFTTGESVGFEELPPKRLIIVEGLFALFVKADINVFVDISTHGRILRRILRDVDRTGQEPPAILKQIVETAQPMHHKHVEGTKANADFIIRNEWNPRIESGRTKLYESQLKFTVNPDSKYLEFIRRIGAERLGLVLQTDTYYNPTGISLVGTGESLRIREEGGHFILAYKGPRIESTFRERPKLEFEIDQGTKEKFLAIYGNQLKVIKKERVLYYFDGLVFSLDTVSKIENGKITNLGKFIEIRTVTKGTHPPEIEKTLAKLGLDISQGIKKSYVEM